MTATEDMPMPADVELVVPQEITLSSPWLKAVGIYMGARCEKEMNEFMLLRREYGNDPRKVIKEGKELTACGVNFIRELRRNCLKEVSEYANCLDHCQGGELLPTYCRQKQYPLDICVDEKMGMQRPAMGYFSKLHVHESKVKPPPQRFARDYKVEAVKTMEELPADWHIRPDRFKRFRPYLQSWYGND